MWRVLRRLGMVMNWLFWRKDLWLSNVHKSLGSVLQTAGGVGAREPDARGRRPQPQWPRLGWPSDWPERIIHTMWLLAYVTLKLIESQKIVSLRLITFILVSYNRTLDLGRVSINHSFSRAQSPLCSLHEFRLTISLQRTHVTFLCFFFLQHSLVMSLHTTNPYIKAKNIRIEHMNRWTPRILWTRVITINFCVWKAFQ